MIPYLHERCLDILQPDCCHTGGITSDEEDRRRWPRRITCRWRRTAPPASWASPPACTWSASIPFFLIHEFYPDNHGFNPKGIARMAWKLDKDGYIGLPPGPGLGVEVDEKLLEEAAKKPQKYKWPGAKLRDGSIADY